MVSVGGETSRSELQSFVPAFVETLMTLTLVWLEGRSYRNLDRGSCHAPHVGQATTTRRFINAILAYAQGLSRDTELTKARCGQDIAVVAAFARGLVSCGS